MEGAWIKEAGAGAAAAVFVHGFLSNSESCWRHPTGTYWPELVAADEQLRDVGVYVFRYRTEALSGSYGPGDAADALREHLQLDGVAERRRIFFVCHSMGGIIVRKYLVDNATELAERKTEVGLFLLASPSLGSAYANVVRPIAWLLGQSQAEKLQFSQTNDSLVDLDRSFTNLKESNRLRLAGKELIEDRVTGGLHLPFMRPLVERFSAARYFAHPYKVPKSDHFSIAKVENSNAVQHRLLRVFILRGAFGRTRTLDTLPASDAGGVVMNGFAPTGDDNINMRVTSREDNRVVLEELVYRFGEDAAEQAERVCLKTLEVEWNWGESHRVTLNGRWRSRSTRSRAVSADNPAIRIEQTQHDAATFSVQFSPADPGVALAPAEDEAVTALVLPGASIMPARGERHRFIVRARKQHLCAARKDPLDGTYRLMNSGQGSLATQADALERAVTTALVEVERGFPEDGRPLVLGVRDAEALPRCGCPTTFDASSRGES